MDVVVEGCCPYCWLHGASEHLKTCPSKNVARQPSQAGEVSGKAPESVWKVVVWKGQKIISPPPPAGKAAPTTTTAPKRAIRRKGTATT